jgi:cobyric acid synthase
MTGARPTQARCLMIQGTTSYRPFARRGYRVAPFKSQNMALSKLS